jgi:hypothetical protein
MRWLGSVGACATVSLSKKLLDAEYNHCSYREQDGNPQQLGWPRAQLDNCWLSALKLSKQRQSPWVRAIIYNGHGDGAEREVRVVVVDYERDTIAFRRDPQALHERTIGRTENLSHVICPTLPNESRISCVLGRPQSRQPVPP